MGSECSSGIQDSIDIYTSKHNSSTVCLFSQRKAGGKPGGSIPSGKRCHSAYPSRGWIYQQRLCGAKRQQQVEADSEFEEAQSVCETRTLQDGRCSMREGSPPAGRLHVQNRSQGCLPVNSHPSRIKEVPEVFMGQQDISVHSTPLRSLSSASMLYQGNETGPCEVEVPSHTNGTTFGRLPDIGKGKQETESHYKVVENYLWSLGFVVNQEKSQKIASQQIDFLGFRIDSLQMTFTLPAEKVKKIKDNCKQALRLKQVTVTDLARIIGTLTATHLAVLPAPLNYRGLQLQKEESLYHPLSYESVVTLSVASRKDLEWWVANLDRVNGRPIHPPQPTIVIESDASNTGWGASYERTRTGGQWSTEELTLHINCKELLAAFLALKTFVKNKKDLHVRLRVDNSTAMYYINRMGGDTFTPSNHSGNTDVRMEPRDKYSALSRTPPRKVEPGSRPTVQDES